MTYRLLALDLDGTLLTEDSTIPAQLIDALQRLIRQDVTVTLATGRAFPTANAYAAQAGITAPLICYNGAQIRRTDGSIVYQHPMPMDLMQTVIRCCRDNGWYLQLYNRDCLVVERITQDTISDPDYPSIPSHGVGPLDRAALLPTPKMITCCYPGDAAFRTAVLHRATGGALNIATSAPRLVEIMCKGVSKAAALQQLCDLLHIPQQQTVVCGDSGNDLEMVRWAGLGCAMGNATPILKNAADYVCRAQYSYGVLEVIEKFFK